MAGTNDNDGDGDGDDDRPLTKRPRRHFEDGVLPEADTLSYSNGDVESNFETNPENDVDSETENDLRIKAGYGGEEAGPSTTQARPDLPTGSKPKGYISCWINCGFSTIFVLSTPLSGAKRLGSAYVLAGHSEAYHGAMFFRMDNSLKSEECRIGFLDQVAYDYHFKGTTFGSKFAPAFHDESGTVCHKEGYGSRIPDKLPKRHNHLCHGDTRSGNPSEWAPGSLCCSTLPIKKASR